MDAATRSRLEKLLGMLGSTFDGERANAARMIAAMAERNNVTIPELVFGTRSSSAFSYRQPEPPQATRPRKREQTAVVLTALRDIAASEAELEFVVTGWEYSFAVDVSEKYEFDYELSAKQLAAAQRIIDKVERARHRGASA